MPVPTRPVNEDDSATGGASGFGASMFDEPGPSRGRSATPAIPDGAFDVCHVGTVLRALLFVQVVLCLGVWFIAESLADGAQRVALGSGVALPAVMLWLGAMCTLRGALARLGPAGQCALAGLLGAAAGSVGWLLMGWGGQGLVGVGPWSATAAGAAFLGVLLTLWLQLRSRSQLPADATARLAELQSRIRPHFLFNTLNSALGLVRRDPVRAEALLEDLAELFRVALADGATVVSLGEEIELARRYLAIEQIRFGERLHVVWQLDPAAAAARLPPLLLQPLVENAVRHGVEPSASGGVIRIRTRVKGGLAWVSIANTLPAAADGPPTPGHGIALQNVRERLRLMHDVAARFETHADADAFRVQLALPL